MTRYFADTFFYLALLSPGDEAHERAVRLNAKATGPSGHDAVGTHRTC